MEFCTSSGINVRLVPVAVLAELCEDACHNGDLELCADDTDANGVLIQTEFAALVREYIDSCEKYSAREINRILFEAFDASGSTYTFIVIMCSIETMISGAQAYFIDSCLTMDDNTLTGVHVLVVSKEMIETWKRNPGLQAKIKDAEDFASKDFYHWRRRMDSIVTSMYRKVFIFWCWFNCGQHF